MSNIDDIGILSGSWFLSTWWKSQKFRERLAAEETRRTRQRRRLCPRLSSCSGNNHKTYWFTMHLHSIALVPIREVPCRRNARKNREGRWKGTTPIIYRKQPSFSSTEIFRGEKHPEKCERVKWKNNHRKSGISNARSPTASRSKFSILTTFIVKLYDHATREKLSR